MGDRVKPAVGHPRLYISRRDATYRRVTNEAELLAVLEPLGFETIVLSDYPL
jgi:capsular polysaccharide biosynthesis protein